MKYELNGDYMMWWHWNLGQAGVWFVKLVLFLWQTSNVISCLSCDNISANKPPHISIPARLSQVMGDYIELAKFTKPFRKVSKLSLSLTKTKLFKDKNSWSSEIIWSPEITENFLASRSNYLLNPYFHRTYTFINKIPLDHRE